MGSQIDQYMAVLQAENLTVFWFFVFTSVWVQANRISSLLLRLRRIRRTEAVILNIASDDEREVRRGMHCCSTKAYQASLGFSFFLNMVWKNQGLRHRRDADIG